MQIQQYLVSAVQNIQVLLRYGSYLKTSPSVMMEHMEGTIRRDIRFFSDVKQHINSKIGRIMVLGLNCRQLSSVET